MSSKKKILSLGEISQLIKKIFDTEIQVVGFTEYLSFENIFSKISYHV